MIYNMLASHLTDSTITIIACVVACILTFVLYIKPFKFLPRDKGKVVTTPDGQTVSINIQSGQGHRCRIYICFRVFTDESCLSAIQYRASDLLYSDGSYDDNRFYG